MSRYLIKNTRNSYEQAIILKDKNTILFSKTSNLSDSVRFTENEIELLRGAWLFLHNHPLSGYLSPADVLFAHKHNIKNLVAISLKPLIYDEIKNKFIRLDKSYFIVKNPYKLNRDLLIESILKNSEEFDLISRKFIDNRVEYGIITEDDILSVKSYFVLQRVAKETGLVLETRSIRRQWIFISYMKQLIMLVFQKKKEKKI